jgi:hypothetical protein
MKLLKLERQRSMWNPPEVVLGSTKSIWDPPEVDEESSRCCSGIRDIDLGSTWRRWGIKYVVLRSTKSIWDSPEVDLGSTRGRFAEPQRKNIIKTWNQRLNSRQKEDDTFSEHVHFSLKTKIPTPKLKLTATALPHSGSRNHASNHMETNVRCDEPREVDPARTVTLFFFLAWGTPMCATTRATRRPGL